MKHLYSRQLHHGNGLPSPDVWRRRSPLTLLILCAFCLTSQAQQNNAWPTAGQNLQNTRHAASETVISPATAQDLVVKWSFETGGDVSATPAKDAQSVYFPDWAGNLYKLNATTGALVWSHPLSYYTGVIGDFARTTPAIAGNSLILGTQLRYSAPGTFNGAHVISVDKNTGELQWMTQIESHFAAVVTQSAIVHGDRIYVGVASAEENFAASNDYPCCSFRGSVVCLDRNSGAILWKTYMTPADPGFSGCAVWGSTPAVDTKRNSLYVTTGNNYTVPQGVLDCVAAGGTPQEVRDCIMQVPGSAENYFDAIVSLDLTTGAVKWANTVVPFDAWTVACFFAGENCPDDAGPDYDFGQGPALFTVGQGGNKRDLLGAGQKSGIYWVVDPNNGDNVWSTQVGPGGELGGLQWGSATDGNRIYVAVSNSNLIPHTMTTGPGAGQTINGGFWASLDATTGAVLWEVAGANPPASPPLIPPPFPVTNPIATNQGPVSVANGVVFGGAMDAVGTMYAFSAATGDILWSYESGGSVLSGAAISDGSIYWGSGYSNFGLGTPNHKIYAFTTSGSAFGAPISPTVTAWTNGVLEAVNNPNPFEASTDIVFTIPKEDQVSLVIYNSSGIEVDRLINGPLAKGEHQVRWNSPQDLPAGTYLYRLTTSELTIVRQMVKVQ